MEELPEDAAAYEAIKVTLLEEISGYIDAASDLLQSGDTDKIMRAMAKLAEKVAQEDEDAAVQLMITAYLAKRSDITL